MAGRGEERGRWRARDGGKREMSECVIGCGLISVIYNRAALVQLHKSPNLQTHKHTHTQTITYMKNIFTTVSLSPT